ncbi:MAG: molybdate ABC transporter substrate-binding protein [Acidobacteria bacterium]|nr:molybdate ABC transporter substrate-binding protein [Acidobacteriota bacterium]
MRPLYRALVGRGRPGRRLRAGLLAACVCGATSGAAAQGITVAAAADLQNVMPRLTARFQEATGRTIGVTFGSSGNFFSQIQNGAPFDLFFSADIEYARRLEAAGFAEPGSLFEYATGRIVVWSRKDGSIDVTRGLQALLDAGVRRIAIANPAHAPYGRAAVAALRHEQLYDRVQAKLILGENVSQAAQFAQSGNADAGIIALSLALDPALTRSGTYYEIPVGFYPSISQAAVVIKASRRKALAREFLAFIQKPDSVRLMQTFGFALSSPGARAQ